MPHLALLIACAAVFAVCAEANTCSPPAQGQLRAAVSDDAWTRITTGMDQFLARIEALEDYPPGAAVIVVTGDGRRYIRVHGETKAGSGHRVTPDSVFYIASMTKAYTGLLAARLDVEGVLPLRTTLADVWPGLTLPTHGRQADRITLRDLLVHSIPFTAEEITFLEAYVRDVAPAEYPALLERYAAARHDGFQYDNLGYNIYAAALEAKTGRNWRVWLKEKVFSPLGMKATSGRTSEYAPDTIAWSHQRAGALRDHWPRANGWYLIPPKADGMMQSAGGLMTSASDMALWLEAHIRGEGAKDSGLTAEVFARARTDHVGRAPDAQAFSCRSYVYGWNVCRLEAGDGVIGPFFQHGGGYTGVRSLMTAAPGMGLAVAFLSNSDSMTGFLSQEVTKLAFELHRDEPGREARDDERIADYRARNEAYLTNQQNRLEKARASEKWKGWAWAPDASALAAFAGSYHANGALMPDATIEVVDGVVFLSSSARRYRLTPAVPDLFGAQTFGYEDIASIAFVRDSAGNVIAMDWDGQRYARR